MARYRETPKCCHCGKHIAKAIYNPTTPGFFGDSFSHWERWLCDCEGAVSERKKIREEMKPIVEKYHKSMEKEKKTVEKLKEKGKRYLKSCPFCGSEAFVGIETMATYWSVGCSECLCKFERQFKTKKKAIKFWNKRN